MGEIVEFFFAFFYSRSEFSKKCRFFDFFLFFAGKFLKYILLRNVSNGETLSIAIVSVPPTGHTTRYPVKIGALFRREKVPSEKKKKIKIKSTSVVKPFRHFVGSPEIQNRRRPRCYVNCHFVFFFVRRVRSSYRRRRRRVRNRTHGDTN